MNHNMELDVSEDNTETTEKQFSSENEPAKMNTKGKDSKMNTKVLCSGSVTTNRILSKAAFTNIVKLGEETNDEEGQPGHRVLRKRQGHLNFNENILFYQQCNMALLSEETDAKRPKLESQKNELEDAPVTFSRQLSSKTFVWDTFLLHEENLKLVPPVEFFKNAPLANIWRDVAKVGIAIELRNPFLNDFDGTDYDRYWFGTIVHFAGYRALVRFETFDNATNYLAWISFCSDVPKPLGWCEKNGKKLDPGPLLSKVAPFPENEIKAFYTKETINDNHLEVLGDNIKLLLGNIHLPVEVMDIKDMQSTRLAKISAIAGDRIHIQYCSNNDNDSSSDSTSLSDGWWFSFKSGCIHPMGWSSAVGLSCRGATPLKDMPISPTPQALNFPPCPNNILIEEDMLLETRHPVYPWKIVGATITKVLKRGYFIIGTFDKDKSARTSFIYHVTSPFIFPWGWGETHGISVDYSKRGFGQRELKYLRLPRREKNHNFVPGLKVEAFDILEPAWCGSATIQKVCDNMLLVQFDSWPATDRNFMWVDHAVSDIYPLGYAEMVGLGEFCRGHVVT